MKKTCLLVCCLALNANAMDENPSLSGHNSEQVSHPMRSTDEVAPPFSFFDAPCPEPRESIFAEDPAVVARRLIRPHRPASTAMIPLPNRAPFAEEASLCKVMEQGVIIQGGIVFKGVLISGPSTSDHTEGQKK